MSMVYLSYENCIIPAGHRTYLAKCHCVLWVNAVKLYKQKVMNKKNLLTDMFFKM